MAERPTPNVRIGSVRGFLPLSDDIVSTRRQKLPSLIHDRSTANIQDLRTQLEQRRLSTYKGFNEYPDPVNDDERDAEQGAGDMGKVARLPTAEEEDGGKKTMGDRSDVLMTPQMRSMRLIGNNNPRYQWEKYYKGEEELKKMKKPTRQYYERNNHLICSYLYIDRLLDSTLPHKLIQEYNQPISPDADVSNPEGDPSTGNSEDNSASILDKPQPNGYSTKVKVKRTPKDLYKVPNEESPLLGNGTGPKALELAEESNEDSGSPIVTFAIYLNLVANLILLVGKIIVIVLTSSLSVLASLVDAALDFLSTAIVWTTTRLISHNDSYAYPVGRRRLEPIGVLVFSVIMITAFFQVALECFNRLTGPNHTVVTLGLPSIIIMASTVFIKAGCWFWCRLIKNSSVQALAQDAMTDVVFNIFSIIFPIVGSFFHIWWLDALGGLLLSFYVIINWSRTITTHIRHLTGAAAPAADRNILLYLTMRFARTIQKIQGLQAYHAGDKLNVEVDIVLDEGMTLRDSHDLGESLQYVLESVPSVDRAFVHMDYSDWNLPNHMQQQAK